MVQYEPTTIDAWKVAELPRPSVPRGETAALGEELSRRLSTRVTALVDSVQATAGFEQWEADDSLASLDGLAQWLTASLRSGGSTELALTPETTSHACDVGIYLGNVLVSEIGRAATWAILVGPKDALDLGLPVVHFGGRGQYLNPMRQVLNLARTHLLNGAAINLPGVVQLWRGALQDA